MKKKIIGAKRIILQQSVSNTEPFSFIEWNKRQEIASDNFLNCLVDGWEILQCNVIASENYCAIEYILIKKELCQTK